MDVLSRLEQEQGALRKLEFLAEYLSEDKPMNE